MKKPLFSQELRLFFIEHSPCLWPVSASLAKKAREAMSEGVHLHVSMENAKVTENSLGDLDGGKYLRICVTDDGIGIAPEHLDRIFELYFTTK